MFDSVTLEISLKPFRQTDNEYITKIVDQVFEQWKLLFRNRKTISLMLWTADGSEILDYTGNLDDEFEWCIYLGTANNPEATEDDPLELSLHWKKRKYMENPPKMTYRILKNIVSIIKAEGKKYFPDAVVRVGETFDIGPEFAVSDFKYRRHLEIITGTGCNDGKNFINSYGILSADDYHYAAYPNGVPEGTPFGTFLGAQTKALFPSAIRNTVSI